MLNISAYKFTRLDRLPQRKRELESLATAHDLLGTILLSHEGINLFLSGEQASVYEFFDKLGGIPEYSDIIPKESRSPTQPFRRMLVRIKKEIIAFGVPTVDPAIATSPKLRATELKKWLDEGRSVCLLDVRNDYEIELGTFHGARHLNIHHFREFPEAIGQLTDAAMEETIVMFCTGGIRCEKAGPLMQQAGFKNVYQLDGGILKYFEDVGGDHWDGSCFVFDSRVALDPLLEPTGDQLCFACQAVLRPSDLASPLYQLGEHCPFCYKSTDVRAAELAKARQPIVNQIARQQLGSIPHDNIRNIYVPRKLAGKAMIDFLTQYQPTIAPHQWVDWIERGDITVNGSPVSRELVVREGQHFVQREPATVEPKINPNIELLYEDDLLVIVNKPAPLPAHPSGRFHRNTLTWILGQAYPKQKLRLAHRIDANTSGVAVVCRTAAASRFVQPQFATRQVEKIYLARIFGHPDWNEITCEAPVSGHPCERGSRVVAQGDAGLSAVTHFQIQQRCADGTSLVTARPITGRTHQLRVHLWHLGHAIVHDPLYLADHQIGSNRTLSVEEPSMNLHAHSIRFTHPASKIECKFMAPTPDHLQSQCTGR